MGYFIKTKSGMKGPVSLDQLQGLLDGGRIPGNLNVLDRETRRWVRVADVLSRAEEAPEAVVRPAPLRGPPGSARRGAPGRRRQRPAAPAEARSPRRWLKTLGLVAGIVALVSIAGFLVWRQDTGLREAGREHIRASGLLEDDLQIALLIADGCHGAALHEATPEDIRGRKRLLGAQKGEYIRILDRMVAERMQRMRETSPRQQTDLLGYWERITPGMRTIVHLGPDGRYAQAFFAPDDRGHQDAVEKHAGTWSLSGGTIHWVYQGRPDPNPFVRFGDLAFAIREMDGSLSYWERLAEHESVTRHFR